MRARPSIAVAALAVAVAAGLGASCLREAEEHLALDRATGVGETSGTSVREAEGRAVLRALEPGRVELWAAAPVLRLEVELARDAPVTWEIAVHNAMPDAVLSVGCPAAGACAAVERSAPRAAARTWEVAMVPGAPHTLQIAPPDAEEAGAYRFAVLSDVQKAIDDVDEIFARMNEEDGLRFVISTGDLTDRGTLEELLFFQEQLEVLAVPFYSTAGNHEIATNHENWHRTFGPYNVRWVFKGVFFSLIDSSAASIDPDVYHWLEPWLDASRGEPHLFATHVPPFETSGTRSIAFRSRTEAAKILAMLVDADVDVAMYGHVHTFESYTTAEIPAYISGGGGANEIRLDGVGRHYLVVDVGSDGALSRVTLVDVDQ